MNPASIRALIAASDGSDQGEILDAAFVCFLPIPESFFVHASTAWQKNSAKMRAMIRAEAYTDAALLIADAVLPGWRRLSDGTYEKPRFVVELYPPTRTHDGIPRGAHHCESLAIIDAVCAAKEG